MAIDIRSLTQTELVRLLNSTPLGPVINAPKLTRQINEAGLRLASTSDPRRINLLKYIAWLATPRKPAPGNPGSGHLAHPVHLHSQGVDYQQKLKRDLARQLMRSKLGRDIGPIPPVVDPARRLRCRTSFRLFCETYFPRAFTLQWSKDHLRVIEKIERATLEGGLFAFAMPRGSGKTTLARMAALWAVLHGHREYVCVVGSAKDHAQMILESIKRDMLGNPLLLEDFPEVIHPIRCLENNARKQIGQLCNGLPTYITWSSDKLVLPTNAPGNSGNPGNPGSIGKDGVGDPGGADDDRASKTGASPTSGGGGGGSGGIITVAGLDSNIRGQQHTKMDGTIIRPSLVILDDPQTRQSAASSSQTRYRMSILKGDVLGMAGPDVKIAGFMTCTKIYEGDLADQLLDRGKNPEWQGECTKMINKFPAGPEAQKLWDRYAQLRADGLRQGDGGKAATTFYRKHQVAMDAGSEAAWPQRFNPDEVSALQHAMNLKLRDEEAFFAEYQNEPMTEQLEEGRLTPDLVMARFNGRPRGQVPQAATCLTMFVDLHDKLLYYAVCAWEPDFTGYVIDYGTFPDQKRRYFSLREADKTLADEMRRAGGGAGGAAGEGAGVGACIQWGLEKLVGEFMARQWAQGGGEGKGSIESGGLSGSGSKLPELLGLGLPGSGFPGGSRIEKCLIDSGYLPGLVGNVRLKLAAGNAIMPSKGVGIRAGGRPMSSYKRKPGERHGHNWYVPNVSRTSEFPHVQFDANWWKTLVHGRLMAAPGDPGSLTLFGKSEAEHRLFAEHVAGSETWVRTEGHGRAVQEWTIKPSRPDNHWFDCLVGCAVAASMCGAKLGIERPDRGPRKRIRLSDIQKRKRGLIA